MGSEPEHSAEVSGSSAQAGGRQVRDSSRPAAPVRSLGAIPDDTILPSGAGVRPETGAQFLAMVREDLALYAEGAREPGFWAVTLHRFRGWTRSPAFPRVLLPPATLIYRLAHLVVQTVFGISLPSSVRLGRRIRIPHQHGIVIHPHASIGDDCVIRQGVSLGAGSGDDALFWWQAPQIGRGVSLGAGCVVVGRVTIGDGATIGPNAVVMTHIPAGATVLAQNPRIIRPQPEGTAP